MRSCPKCKSSDYNNRSFILMINECGHSLCKNCVENLFARNSGPCHVCGRTLKKNGFWEQTFDDPGVEKEVHVRKKLQKIFNLKEDCFPDLRSYNDYLEKYEEFVFNLTNDVDVEATKEQIEEFQNQNNDLIVRNRTRRSKDEEWIQRMLEEDKRFRNRVAGFYQEDASAMSQQGGMDKEARAVIEELRTSKEPAAFIVNNKQRQQRQQQEMTKNTVTTAAHGDQRMQWVEESVHGSMFVPEGLPYVYTPLVLSSDWSPDLSDAALLANGYLKHIRAATADQLAGGYRETLGCARALFDAVSDLLVV